MDKSLFFNDKTLKRIPPGFVLMLLAILGVPSIALIYLGMDFTPLLNTTSGTNDPGILLVQSQMHDYFRQILLQWSTVSLSIMTLMLAITQYRLTKNKIAAVIGCAVLFSGSIEALHTIIADRLAPYILDKQNIDSLIWTFASTLSGIVIIIGLLLLPNPKSPKPKEALSYKRYNLLFLSLMFSVVYSATYITNYPLIPLRATLFTKPPELLYLTTYLLIIFIWFPKIYKRYPSVLTRSILYTSIAQTILALYFLLVTNPSYDHVYHITYALQLIVYFIPFSCLITNYVFSYNEALAMQNQLQISQEQLQYLAAHDPLTNLYNRREFEILLGKTIANCNREHCSFAVLLIDMDNFKQINDTLGHMRGDNFLKQFATELSSLTRKGDILSRIGGDEFTLITPKLLSPLSARYLAERIINGLNLSYTIGNTTEKITVSIGISIYPFDGETTEELLKNADSAMYQAKKSGKNTFRFC